MEIGKKKANCLNCQTRMTSSFVVGDLEGEQRILQCWYFKCPSCQQTFKYEHSNQKLGRNVFFLLLIFVFAIATVVLFLIGLPKTKIAGVATLLVLLFLLYRYPKNAYDDIKRINVERFNLVLEEIGKIKERDQIIEAHRKATYLKRTLRSLIVLVIVYVARELLKRAGFFN